MRLAILFCAVYLALLGTDRAAAQSAEGFFSTASPGSAFGPAGSNSGPGAFPSQGTFGSAATNQQFEFGETACAEGCGWFDNLTVFTGLDGSKQPQDFGVNANLGGRFEVNWGIPILPNTGVGLQIGTAVVAAGNAVRVYELLGEDTGRTQSFTTFGLYQRTDSGFSWGFGYDVLYENSFDTFWLGQWRLRTGYQWNESNDIGITLNLAAQRDSGYFNSALVTLDPITQGNVYWRHFWQTGTQTTFWAGMAEGHGESNAVTGYSQPQAETFVFGADILAPLNDYLALYGETNIILPADTGTVDAFLGVTFYPGGGALAARRTRFAPVLPVAGSPTFSVDLSQ